MVQIKFIASGANSVLGAFQSGDEARVSEAFAKHLVEEAHVAKYVDQPIPIEQKLERKVKRGRA